MEPACPQHNYFLCFWPPALPSFQWALRHPWDCVAALPMEARTCVRHKAWRNSEPREKSADQGLRKPDWHLPTLRVPWPWEVTHGLWTSVSMLVKRRHWAPLQWPFLPVQYLYDSNQLVLSIPSQSLEESEVCIGRTTVHGLVAAF